MTKYHVNVGINYPPNKRAEAGDVVDDIPEKSVKSLLKDGTIEVAGKEKKTLTEKGGE